jgi:TPR repeat protein
LKYEVNESVVKNLGLRIIYSIGLVIAVLSSTFAQDMTAARLKQIEQEASYNQELAFQLGYAYLQGTNGLNKDLGKAKIWLKETADGYPVDIHVAKAAYLMGQIYLGLEDHAVKKNKAKKYFSIAANYSGEDAMPDAGYLAASVTEDDNEYITLLEKSGLAEYMPALLELYSENVNGTRGPINERAAVKWLKKAAKLEHVEAQALLGSFYFNGHIVYQDNEQAYYWTVRAAEQNNIDAQGRLGLIHKLGLGRPVDLKKAQLWYERAAKQGNLLAKENLAKFFLESKDPEKQSQGLVLLEEVANSGVKTAALELAQIYELGLITPKNNAKSIYWQEAASKLGDASNTQLIGLNKTTGKDKTEYRVNSAAIQHYSAGLKLAQNQEWQAAKLELEKAALMNYPAAQLDLARVFISIAQAENNDSLFESAYAWVKIANEANQDGASELLAQIAEALPTKMLESGLQKYSSYKSNIKEEVKN